MHGVVNVRGGLLDAALRARHLRDFVLVDLVELWVFGSCHSAVVLVFAAARLGGRVGVG